MKKRMYSALLVCCCALLPALAHAYVGPGAGLSAIGSILAFLGAIFLLIVGFFWYPIKRLVKGRKKNSSQEVGREVSEGHADPGVPPEKTKTTKI